MEESQELRTALWREVERYATSLPPKELPYIDPVPTVEALREAIGWRPPRFPESAPVVFERAGADFRAEYFRCFATVLPGLRAYGLLVVPRGPGPFPLLVVHHGAGGSPELVLFLGGNYFDQATGAIERGYAVLMPQYLFCPYYDRDNGTPIPRMVREQIDEKLRAEGTSLLAVEIAKQRFLLDAVLQRLDIDASRVAGTGLSYGGFLALYAAALDERIGATVVSCAFRARSVQNPAKPIARLTIASSMELAGMVCPRPLHIHAGLQDPIYSIDNVRDAIAPTVRRYEEAGAAANFEYVEFEGGHVFHGRPVWEFLDRLWNPTRSGERG